MSQQEQHHFNIQPMTQAEAETIARWQYEPPYDFYNAVNDADDLAELLDPAARGNAYYSLTSPAGELVGFYQITAQEESVTLGLGLRPDWTGQGWGERFVRQGLTFALEQYHPIVVRLAVAAFNRRAIRVYERLGFQPVQSYRQQTNGGVYEFVAMEYRPQEGV